MIIGLDTFGKPVETADLYVKTTCFRIFLSYLELPKMFYPFRLIVPLMIVNHIK